MVSIALRKGLKLELGKIAPGLNELHLALEWPAPSAIEATKGRSSTGANAPAKNWDLDIWLLEVDAGGECLDLVFYKKFQTDDGAISRSADDLDGSDGGETCTIRFASVRKDCMRIVVGITIHQAELRRQHFGLLSGGEIRLDNTEEGKILAKGDLPDLPSGCAAVEIGIFLRQQNGSFTYEPVETGFKTVPEWLNAYGIEVAQ